MTTFGRMAVLIALLSMPGISLLSSNARPPHDDPILDAPVSDESGHPETCPQGCERCGKLIGRVLDFLVEKQEKDGHWPGGNEINHYEMTATALSALALLAGESDLKKGRHQATIQKAYEWIVKNLDKDWRMWDFAFAGIFLAQLQRKNPSDETKSAMSGIVKKLIPARRHGGWGHCAQEVFAYPSTMVSATNWVFISLLEMKRAGASIEEKDLKIAPYYQKTQHHNGGLIYGFPTSHGGPEPGRTAHALYNLLRSGEQGGDVYTRALPYAREQIKRGKIAGMGGVMDYLGCALLCHALGKDDWQSFRKSCYERVLLSLENDQFYRYPTDKDTDHNENVPAWTDFWTQQDWYMAGPYFTQALFVLILELPLEHLSWKR